MTPETFLARTLTKVCPGTKLAYRPRKAPPLPWFAYNRMNGEEFYADNGNYARMPKFRVELLLKEDDPSLIGRFEAALSELGTWKLYDSDYIDTENCLIYDYRLSMSLSKLRESEASNG